MIGDQSFFVSAFQPTQHQFPHRPSVAMRPLPSCFQPSSSLQSPQHRSHHMYRCRNRRRTIHQALPTPDELGLHPATLPSFLSSFGDLIHATTTHSHEALSNAHTSHLLSDSTTPHFSFNEVLREVEEEVVAEIRSEFTQTEPHIEITPEMEEIALNDVGHDLIIFLTISAIVAPMSTALGISPVLLYLLFGLVCGPHGLQLLRGNEEVGFELGDFGILFLLFVEGLNLSPERLRELGSFFSLGATQLLFSVGVIFFGLFLGGPLLFQVVSNPNVPIDPLIVQLLEQPVVAFAIAAAGALSSSAFVLPILKEKGWEDRPDGVAALTILLLQDLAVAPLLVILPLVADLEGVGVTAADGGGADPIQLGVLAFKATVGFGAVLALASVALRKVFQIVASSRSSQSFVAASLLVAVGMGVISDALGLSSTTGAFAAGVLLAESGYRAQIEADINPFEGILLGIFFVTAGSALDPSIVIQYWPTLVAGISAFLFIKFSVIYAGGGALGLTKGDSARIGLLLAGGGEFAFVVFNIASDNGIIPSTLGKILTASVIISMALTPVLGEVAEFVGGKLDVQEAEEQADQWFSNELEYDVNSADEAKIKEAFARFDKDGNGEITAEELQNIFSWVGERDGEGEFLTLDQVKVIISRFDDNGDGVLQYDEFAQLWMAKRKSAMSEDALRRAVVVCGYNEVGQQLCALLDRSNIAGIPYVAFARDAGNIAAGAKNGARVIYGDGSSGALIKAAGVEEPTAIAVTYDSFDRCLRATACLRDAFPDTPIFVRCEASGPVKELVKAGATEVIVASGTVAKGIGKLLGVSKETRFGGVLDDSGVAVKLRDMAFPLYPPVAKGSGKILSDIAEEIDSDRDKNEMRKLFKLFSTSLSLNDDGKVKLSELTNEILRTSKGVMNDDDIREMLGCDSDQKDCFEQDRYVTFSEFVTLYKQNLLLSQK